jgi:hypothetical protein
MGNCNHCPQFCPCVWLSDPRTLYETYLQQNHADSMKYGSAPRFHRNGSWAFRGGYVTSGPASGSAAHVHYARCANCSACWKGPCKPFVNFNACEIYTNKLYVLLASVLQENSYHSISFSFSFLKLAFLIHLSFFFSLFPFFHSSISQFLFSLFFYLRTFPLEIRKIANIQKYFKV